jgi:hypothetical protein
MENWPLNCPGTDSITGNNTIPNCTIYDNSTVTGANLAAVTDSHTELAANTADAATIWTDARTAGTNTDTDTTEAEMDIGLRNCQTSKSDLCSQGLKQHTKFGQQSLKLHMLHLCDLFSCAIFSSATCVTKENWENIGCWEEGPWNVCVIGSTSNSWNMNNWTPLNKMNCYFWIKGKETNQAELIKLWTLFWALFTKLENSWKSSKLLQYFSKMEDKDSANFSSFFPEK